MSEEDIKPLSESLRTGWAAALLPIIILAPFVIDATMKTTLTNLVTSAGAKAFSGTLLIFTPGVAAVYCMLISKTGVKETFDILGGFQRLFRAATVFFIFYCLRFWRIGMDKAPRKGQDHPSSQISLTVVTLFFAVIGMILQLGFVSNIRWQFQLAEVA